MKILIVEDSATLRHAMCQYISNAGHTPIVAENGETALQIIDTTAVDMVVMDVEMPGLDGYETTHLIREWLGELWIPIIFVTGKNEEEDLRQGIDAGGDDYLIKPISEAILLAKIRAMERITEMRDQLKRLNEELTLLSERDSLTNLYNRRTFEERATSQWRHAARNREALAVLLLDIDHFKLYNDCYGHLAGDDCIIKVANAIRKGLNRPGDVVARYGGEEFIALLPDTREEGAYEVAERIRHNVEMLGIEHCESPTARCVTVSIGGAVISHTAGTRFLDQVNAADKALYAAKDAGRNQVIIKLFNPKTTVLVADNGNDLAEAIDGRLNNHFALLHTRNSDDTLDQVIRNRPDVLVIHSNLKGLGGLDTARAIRRNPATAQAPIIAICDTCEAQWLAEGEASVCLSPPVDTAELLRHLNEILF